MRQRTASAMDQVRIIVDQSYEMLPRGNQQEKQTVCSSGTSVGEKRH